MMYCRISFRRPKHPFKFLFFRMIEFLCDTIDFLLNLLTFGTIHFNHTATVYTIQAFIGDYKEEE